jgi:oligopeptide/dipeptide ABC transporter ATP-binding protein
LSLLFISHDLSVVRAISDRVVVMYLGKVCEVSPANELSERPLHHYTHALVSAVPIPDPTKVSGRAVLEGEPPSPTNPPSGCRFRTRCPAATDKCAAEEPQLTYAGNGHYVACHHPRA